MSKKDIIVLSWNGLNDVGGVERVMQLVTDTLSEKFEVGLIDDKYCRDKYPKRYRLLGNTRIGQMILLSYAAHKMKTKNDILIGNGFNAPFVKKEFNFAHGTMYLLKKKLRQFPFGGSTIFEILSMKSSKHIIAVSLEAKETLIKKYHINKEKITVLNNCVNDDKFYPAITSDSNKKCHIIFVGRLEERKGYKTLLLLAQLIENRNDVDLSIATPDTMNVEIFESLKNTKLYIKLKYDEMNDFYNSGNVMFFPSISEGFEMVTLECLSSGVPVVCYGAGAGGEILKKSGPGVYLAKGQPNDELVNEFIKISSEYNSIEAKRTVHDWISANYGVQNYKNELLKIVSKLA